MLVDDSHEETSPLKESLLDAGYDVVETANTAAALLERVAALQPDVIIIDIDSPTRDTLEQLSFVTREHPRPIVLFTDDRESATICLPISAEILLAVDSRLKMDECLRQLHVVTPEDEILVGWDAVSCLARLFPSTWLIGAAGQRFPFRNWGRLLYGFVAKNRYSLSKCRGGACRVAKPEAVRRQARLSAFWSCYTLGFFIRLPLVLWAGMKASVQRTNIFARTYHKRLDLLNGKLTILFLNGFLPNTVPLLFGELFTTVLYDGIAVDPGSPKMRRSLARHLRRDQR